MSEKLCFKWNDFQEKNSASGKSNDFTDVTFACADGQQSEAHRVILAASSPIFNDLLKNAVAIPYDLLFGGDWVTRSRRTGEINDGEKPKPDLKWQTKSLHMQSMWKGRTWHPHKESH